MSDLVWCFDRPHRVGSVCGETCEQCGVSDRIIIQTNADAEILPPTPLLIIANATEEQWRESVLAYMKKKATKELCHQGDYFYFVSTD